MSVNLTLGQGLTIGSGITFGSGTGGGGGGYSTVNVIYTFGSVSGSTVSDTSGNGKNGTIVGSASTSTDSHGAYIYLHNGAYIDITGVNLDNSFTISMVASIDSSQTYWASLWANETWSSGQGFVSYLSAVNNLDVTVGGHTGGNQNISVGSYTLSDIAQWDFVYDVSTFSLTVYRNGSVIQSSVSFSPPAGGVSMNDFYIGARHTNSGGASGPTDWINMKLYKFNLYNSALNSSQISSAFASNDSQFSISSTAPIAGTYNVTVNAVETNYSLGLSSNVTGSYNSVTIVSQYGSGTATVSGTDIVYSGSPASGYNTLTLIYTVSGTNGTSNQGTITVQNGNCCVVASALTQQGLWTPRQYKALNIWGAEVLDKSFAGRALHKGYHIIAPKVVIPGIKQKGTLKAKYFKWSFDNSTKMLRGKKYDKLSIVNSALWIGAMTVTGLFTTQKQAEKSWQSIYKDNE